MQVKDICGKGRQYKAKDGSLKNEWVKVGRLVTKDDGSQFISFNSWINPAGFNADKGEVLFSVFEPKPKETKDVPF